MASFACQAKPGDGGALWPAHPGLCVSKVRTQIHPHVYPRPQGETPTADAAAAAAVLAADFPDGTVNPSPLVDCAYRQNISPHLVVFWYGKQRPKRYKRMKTLSGSSCCAP